MVDRALRVKLPKPGAELLGLALLARLLDVNLMMTIVKGEVA